MISNIAYNYFSNNQKINAYQNETESVYHKIRNSINVNDFINISNNKNIETNQYIKSNEKIIELDENNQVIIPKDVKEYIPQLVNDNINNHIRTYTNGIWYSLYVMFIIWIWQSQHIIYKFLL